jgi:hypothetical protein
VTVCGPAALAAGCAWWLVTVGNAPDYLVAYLPGNLLAGVAGGLTQAPLFASVLALPADRAATGTAILSLIRQISSPLGVAMLVAIIGDRTGGIDMFRVAWVAMVAAALLAAVLGASGVGASPRAEAAPMNLDPDRLPPGTATEPSATG